MARFRGSNWKKSRRLGISLSGTGKEYLNDEIFSSLNL